MLAGLGAMAETDVWIGESNGNWSTGANWLDGTAPLAGGDALQILRFTNPGVSAPTSTNNLPGTFALNALLFEQFSPGMFTLAGSPLRLTGTTPTIGILGTGSSTIATGLILGPTSGSVSITGSGSGSLTIAGTISESGGAQRLVISATPATANVQTMTLSGTNTFTGGVLLQSGNLALNSNGALGTGAFTVQGGTLRLGSVTVANAVALEANLLIQAASSATLSGVIASTTAGTGLDLRYTSGTLTLTGVSTYSGATTLDKSLAASVAASAAGTLRLSGSGSLLNSPVIQINAGGLLLLDTATTGTVNRLGDSAEIRLRSGRLTYGSVSGNATAQIETVGVLSGAGYSTVNVSNTSSGSVRLVAGALSRIERGTFLFSGSSLGNSFAGSVGNVLFTAAPAGLVGGGGSGSDTSILPFAIGDTTAGGSGTSFVTYSATTGIRPLSVTTEYTANLTTALATSNVRLTSAVTNDVARSINALALSGGSLTGTGSLTVNGGAVLVSGSTASVANSFIFGTREANFFTVTGLTVSGAIGGSGGLTKSGTGQLTLTGANTFTGPLTVNAGVLSFSSGAGIGADNSAIVINNGQGAGLTYTGAGALTLARPIEVRTGVARFETQGGDLTLAGGISGAGGARFAGSSARTVVLAPANSYSGPTVFAGPSVRVGSDAALGSGGAVDFAGGRVVLGGNWTTGREISISTAGTLDTAGFAAAWSGEFTGTGGFAKLGSGELTLSRSALFSGAVTINAGTVRLADAGALWSTAYTIALGAGLVLDQSAAAGLDRVNNGAALTMNGGELRLTGNAAGAVSETVGSVSAPLDIGSSTITLVAPGSFGTTLRLKTGITAGSGDFLLRGTNLGGAPGGAFTRVLSDLPPAPGTLLLNVVADPSASGPGASFAIYDATADAAGTIGYRPFRAGEFTTGAVLQNPANGGATDASAHYLAGAGTTAAGASNTIQSLTLDSGGSVSLASGQTLNITSGGVLTRSGGGTVALSGGTLAFNATAANFYAAGDATLNSAVTGSGGFKKAGPGVLTFGGAAGYSGGTGIVAGTLRAGAGGTFAAQRVSVGAASVLAFATGTASVGAVTGAGEVAIGTGTLTLGALGSDFSFAGSFTGSGGLLLTDGGNSAALREFTGTSAFTGAVTLNSGRLSLGRAAALGSGPLIVNGGSLRVPSSASALTPAFQLNTDLLVLGSNRPAFGAGTTVSGARDVAVQGSGGLSITGPLTLPARLRATFGPDDEFMQSPGAISVSGAQGALLAATEVRLNAGGSLELDYSTAFTGGAAGRLGDTVPVRLGAATLKLIGNSAASVSETVGSVSAAGFSTVLLTPALANTTALTAATLDRTERGTFLVKGSAGTLGGVAGANVGQFKLGAAPALIGGGGAGPATSIVPWAVGQDTGTGLVTYDSNGFRLLTAGEYATSLAGALATHNVQLTATATNNGTQTVNSLTFGFGGSIAGSGKIIVTSGVVLQTAGVSSTPTVIDNQLDFGTAEGQIFLPGTSPGSVGVTGVISGSNGVTRSGTGYLTLSGSNTFTGPLTINGGAINFYTLANLGVGASPIVLHGHDAELRLLSTGQTTLAREVRLGGGFSRLSTFYADTSFVIGGLVSGAGGLQIGGGGMVVLGAGNTYAGPTIVAGGLAIAADSSLGTGTGMFFSTGANLRLDGDWTTARRLEIQGSTTVNTNGHDAAWNGALVRTGSGALTKSGAGTLALNTASTFSGSAAVSAGALRLAGLGALATTSFTVSSGGALVLDNAGTVVADRLADSAAIALNGGELRLQGRAGFAVAETTGVVTAWPGSVDTITLTAPGSAGTTLRFGGVVNYGVLIFRGDQLGGAPGGSRVTFAAPPVLGNALASASSAGGALALAVYDAGTDAAGIIGVRPLGAADFTTGAEIRNPANGGTTPVTANFRATGATTAGGALNTISSLTLGGSATLSLDASQTLALQTPGLLVEAGANVLVSGGTLSFGTGSALFHTEGPLTVRSALTAGSVTKSGSGPLFFEPATPYAGSFYQFAGAVRVGPGDALRDAAITMSAGTTLDFASNPAGVVALNGTGAVSLGMSTLRTTGSSTFTGDISGSGGVLARGSFALRSPVSYTGATTVIGDADFSNGTETYALLDSATALGSSSFAALGGAVLRLDNSGQVLSRISAVPVALNSGRLELVGNTLTPVAQSFGPLTGTGFSTVNVDNSSGRRPVTAAFPSLLRQDRGAFFFYGGAADTRGPLGDGLATLTFGAGLSAALVGANTTATNRRILPFAANTADSSTYNLVTYDPVTGIRPLAAAEYASALSAGNNVLLTGYSTTSDGDLSINSLTFSSYYLFGTGALSIASGTLLSTQTSGEITKNLGFGSVEAHFLRFTNLLVSGVVSGTNGLTKSGFAELTLSGVNTFTGPLTINAGTLTITSMANLGADPSAIVLNDATLKFATPGATLTRALRLNGGGWSGLSGPTSGGALTVAVPITGTGGLRATGNVTLTGANTFSGDVKVGAGSYDTPSIGTLTINGEAALGAGPKLLLGGTLALSAPWTTNRAVEMISNAAVLDVGSFNATIAGPLTGAAYSFTKTGSGRLTLNTTAGFAGPLTIAGGSVRFDNGGGVANRFGDSASLILAGGELELLGNATAATDERFGALTLGSGGLNRLTVAAPGSAPTTLRFTTFTPGSNLLTIRADALGNPTGGYTRILFDFAPGLIGGALPGVRLADAAGEVISLATYDAGTDAAGTVGVRALGAAEYESGSPIRNPANGGTTPVTANFRAAGPVVTVGASNTIQTLTFGAGGALSLDPGETLAFANATLIVPPGVNDAAVSGGTLAFGSLTAALFVGGDVTLGSRVAGSAGLLKDGGGAVTLAARSGFTGSVQIARGTLRLGADEALAGQDTTLSAGGTLAVLAGRSASVGILAGAGAVTLGDAAQLSVLTSSAFPGAITGAGTLRIGPSVQYLPNVFTPAADYAFTGPTLVDGGTLRLNGTGRLLATSGVEARAGGVLSLETTVLSLPAHLPVTLTAGTFSVQTGSAALSAGPLAARGFSTVQVAHDNAGVQLDIDSLSRGSEGTGSLLFKMSNATFGAAPGAGVANVRFGGGFASQLVGAGTSAVTRPVVPYAVGSYPSGAASGYGLLTYDAANGLRLLAASEYSSTVAAGANVRGTPALANSVTVAINSLFLQGVAGNLYGTGTVQIASGLIVADNISDISNNIDFGAVPGTIFSLGSTLSLNGQIRGSAGLVINGIGSLNSSVRMYAGNTFSGPVTLNNAGIDFTDVSALGSGTEPISFFGLGAYSAWLKNSGSSALTITRPLILGSGQATFSSGSGSAFTLSGPVSGPGGLTLTSPTTLSGNNSYSGLTNLRSSTTMGSSTAFGNSSKLQLEQGGIVHLTAPWTFSQPVEILSYGTNGGFDTNGFDATLHGPLSGDVAQGWGKSGAGRLTVDDASAYRGSITVAGGELRLIGTVPTGSTLTVNAGATVSGSIQTGLFFNVSGTLAPGDGVGPMQTGQLYLAGSSTLAIQLVSAALYDQVQVTGTVTIGAYVNLTLDLGFDPVDSVDQFTLILNDGTDAVSLSGGGRLSYAGNPLDEGELFAVGSQWFQLSYAGGSGNDVVLSAVAPEPGSAALLLTGALAFANRRVRSKRRG